MHFKVLVTFRDGTSQTKEFEDMVKADRYFSRYNNMTPDPHNSKTQVKEVAMRMHNENF